MICILPTDEKEDGGKLCQFHKQGKEKAATNEFHNICDTLPCANKFGAFRMDMLQVHFF